MTAVSARSRNGAVACITMLAVLGVQAVTVSTVAAVPDPPPGAAALAAKASAAASAAALAQPRPHVPRVSPPVPFPEHPVGLPAQARWGSAIEPLASYQPQLSCAAAPMPGTASLRDLALSSYGRGSDGGAIRACATGGQSEHKEGRAWDWMLDVAQPAERRAAGDFLAWLLAPGSAGRPAAMARRLGVMYVIYNRKIWATYSPGWRDYSGADPHTSHIHVSLSWNGARGTTSFWTGTVPAPDLGTCTFFTGQPAVAATSRPRTHACPAAAASPRGSAHSLAWLGSSGDQVRRAQQLLGLAATGTFGSTSRHRVLAYQRGHDLPRTGALDDPTWASLDPASRSQSAPTWTAAQAATWGTRAGSPFLHRTSAGTAVFAVQVALGMPDRLRTGFLGSRTARAVGRFRVDHGMSRSGQVTSQVWAAL